MTAITAAAAFLRFWHLQWALEDRLIFPDEIVWFVRAAQFIPLTWASFDLDFTHFYPTLYGYLAGLATAAAHAADRVHEGPDAVFQVVLVARVVAAILGMATVGVIGVLGWRGFSAPVGLLAAALAAVLPLEAMVAHYASVESLLTGLFALTLIAAYELALRGGVGRALAAGACVGLAFATKYTGLAGLAALGVPLLVRARRGDGWTGAVALGAVVVVGLGAGVAAGCPPCVLRPDDLFGAMRMHFALTTRGDFQNARLVPSLGWVGTPYVYELFVALPATFGWPLWLLSLAGVVVALRRRTLADRVLLAALAAYFVTIGASPLVYPRYMLPLAPGLVVLAARAGVAVAGHSVAGRVAVASVWLYTFVLTAAHVASTSLAQQKQVAAWIAARPEVQRNRRVATPERGAQYYSLVPFITRAGLEPVVLAQGEWLLAPSDVLVVPELLAIGIRRDAPTSVAARDLERLEAGDAGFRRVAHWPMHYLHRGLTAYFDPGVSTVFGPCGFTVYVRDRPA